ncbi:hypothetical protein BJ684DRAFT_20074 [Piptocephalis cylindrospora]|uniref:Signal recognition particle subunit SRP68 n=1 Tax=Piptocephalis cylindrospora TaxID=1907219 RepID=A0A4P9Y3J0_9FUNG|nr:hypothetical protein BJ684DRAFT_20074 [Piptocephalis cylindrospora]|eukprot:RKP13435.1 hypothetical protein BJ684DRAFT_20074 [Piptocephalis cylindrospora]
MADTSSQTQEPISLDILAIVHAARSAHGLRQDDFELYRHFCTKRASHLRRALKLQHTKADKAKDVSFQRLTLTVDQVADARHLEIVLFDAERAFAYAKELKEGTRDEPAKRHHMRKRLKKASSFAQHLALLSTHPRVDTVTQLGIKAYAGIIYGELAQEMREWSSALESFYQSSAIYQGFIQVASTPLASAMAQAAISDVEPHIRFCQYHLQGSPVDPSQWNHLIQETKEAAGTGQEEARIHWFGEILSLRDTKVARAMEKAREVETVSSGSSAAFQAWARVAKVLRRAVKTYESASSQVRRPKGPGLSSKSSGAETSGDGELRRFVGAVEWRCLKSAVQCDVERVRLIDTTSARGIIGVPSSTVRKELGSDQALGLGWDQAISSVDRILRRLSRTSTRAWVQEDARVQDLLEEATQYFSVMRTHTIASLYASRGQWKEAYALESHALHAHSPLHFIEDPSGNPEESMHLIDSARDDLASRIRRAKVLAQAFSATSFQGSSGSLGPEGTWPTHLWGYQGIRSKDGHVTQWVDLPMTTSSLLPKPVFLDVVYDRVAQVPDDVYTKAGRPIPPRPLVSSPALTRTNDTPRQSHVVPSGATSKGDSASSEASSSGLWGWLGGK